MTKEKFQAFEAVRLFGDTNMFDIPRVMELAEDITGEELSYDDCTKIMENYSQLKKQYC